MAEQRYLAGMAVIGDGLSVLQAAEKAGVSRQTLHTWPARYEAEGLEGLVDRSHRPASCPHQMPAQVEAVVLELRRSRPYWGPRRLVFELAKRQVAPLPSESAVYRASLRAAMIDPADRDRRARKWKRWERGVPMELSVDKAYLRQRCSIPAASSSVRPVPLARSGSQRTSDCGSAPGGTLMFPKG